MEDPLLFVATALVILAAPGPTNTLLAMSGAIRGVRRSLPLLPAEAAGYLLSVTFLGLLGPALASAPGVAHILRPLVGAYLLFLAFRLSRQGSASSVSAANVRALDVFVATVFNPKALVFAVAVIPFQRPDVWTYFAAFLAVLGLAGAGWLTVGAAMGRAAPSGAVTRVVPRVGSAVLAVFAGLMIYPSL